MAEQEDRQAGVAGLGELDDARDVADVLLANCSPAHRY
jgi:hypothetical protein